ncbi:uncharacterized protein LOC8283869 [Ricinus communis]|uniref:Uncharacterized protein n=1 Tax=Ricinus communis TaxID=3988 RepID=B9SGV9_RICCO|nr:uncharacterized protein LOC8283869 [Ricinus communis]EEF37194.1 conserved hypothetical protein [Ricinus communis]|eukprot:XP_002525228.1 uncharacterized protein LOC8283869 [Ricinus communis]
MERENNNSKRRREGDQEAKDSAKKQHHNIDINKQQQQQEQEAYESSSDNYLGLGVFEFPWLNESMISKSEEWYFEDSFSLCDLHDTSACTTAAAASPEFSGQCLSETCMESLHIPLEKFEECVWSLEMDQGVECTWGSLHKSEQQNRPCTL